MSLFESLFYSGILPAAVTLILLWISHPFPENIRRISRLIFPFFAFLMSFYPLFGLPMNPLIQVTHWIVFLPLVYITYLGIHYANKGTFSRRIEAWASVVTPVLIAALLLESYQIEIPWVFVVAVTLLGIGYSLLFFRAYRVENGTAALGITFVFQSVFIAVLYMTGGLAQSQLLGVFAALTATYIFWNSIRPQQKMGPSVYIWSTLPLIFISLTSFLYSETPATYVLTLWVFGTLSLGLEKMLRNRSLPLRLSASLVLFLVPASYILWMCYGKFSSPV